MTDEMAGYAGDLERQLEERERFLHNVKLLATAPPSKRLTGTKGTSERLSRDTLDQEYPALDRWAREDGPSTVGIPIDDITKAVRATVVLAYEGAIRKKVFAESQRADIAQARAIGPFIDGLEASAAAFDAMPASYTLEEDAAAVWEEARDHARALNMALRRLRALMPKARLGAHADVVDQEFFELLGVSYAHLTGRRPGRSNRGPFVRFATAAYLAVGLGTDEKVLEQRLGKRAEKKNWGETA